MGKDLRQGLGVTQANRFHDLQFPGDEREHRIDQTGPCDLAAPDARGQLRALEQDQPAGFQVDRNPRGDRVGDYLLLAGDGSAPCSSISLRNCRSARIGTCRRFHRERNASDRCTTAKPGKSEASSSTVRSSAWDHQAVRSLVGADGKPSGDARFVRGDLYLPAGESARHSTSAD
jgi:hypothetical protein